MGSGLGGGEATAAFMIVFGALDGIPEGVDVTGEAVMGAGVNLDGSIEGVDVIGERPKEGVLLKLGFLEGVDEN